MTRDELIRKMYGTEDKNLKPIDKIGRFFLCVTRQKSCDHICEKCKYFYEDEKEILDAIDILFGQSDDYEAMEKDFNKLQGMYQAALDELTELKNGNIGSGGSGTTNDPGNTGTP